MKSFPVAFLVLLIFILSVHRGVTTRGSDVAKFCCFQYSHKILPWKWIQSYKFTRSSCSQQAVIFTTKKAIKSVHSQRKNGCKDTLLYSENSSNREC